MSRVFGLLLMAISFSFVFLGIFKTLYAKQLFFSISLFIALLLSIIYFFAQKRKPQKRYALTNKRIILHAESRKESKQLKIPLEKVTKFDTTLDGPSNYEGKIHIPIKNLNIYDQQVRAFLDKSDNEQITFSVKDTNKFISIARRAMVKLKGSKKI